MIGNFPERNAHVCSPSLVLFCSKLMPSSFFLNAISCALVLGNVIVFEPDVKKEESEVALGSGTAERSVSFH